MNLTDYYKSISDIEAAIQEEFPLIVSKPTPDGGRAGIVTEVSRRQAAKAIVDGRAALADEEQKAKHLAGLNALKQAAQASELSKRLQVAIISDPQFVDRAMKPQNGEGSQPKR